MGQDASFDQEPAVYAHHVRALRARQKRENDEAIGAHLGRGGSRDQDRKRTSGSRAGVGCAKSRIVDWFSASPLTGRDRQTGGFRVPHFDVKAITPTHAPMNAAGNRRGHKAATTAGEHYDYITDGTRIGISTHIDYICRVTGLDDPVGQLAMDALDEQELRNEKNRLAYYTNIPGGRERERSLFEAVERAVTAPQTYHLIASTADAEALEMQLRLGGAEPWFRKMTARLRTEREKVEQAAAHTAAVLRHEKVVIAEVGRQRAFEMLDYCDRQPGIPHVMDWKPGRTERSYFRFVGELPDNLSASDRREIMTRFCDTLHGDGWMVVGAIHQPDAHNDRRNFHIHVDAVDRKAEWLGSGLIGHSQKMTVAASATAARKTVGHLS